MKNKQNKQVKENLFNLENRYYFYFIFILLGLFSLYQRELTPLNELKYFSIAKEALSLNHWFSFSFYGQAYSDKPPLYFWIIMLAMKLFSLKGATLFVGLFSLLPAIGICEVMVKLTKPYLSKQYTNLAILVLMTSGLFFVSSLIIRMDMLMCFFITLSLYYFYLAYDEANHAQSIYPKNQHYHFKIVLSICLAVLVKGPMGFIIPIFSILVFLGSQKQLKTIGYYFSKTSILIGLGIILGWFYLVYQEAGLDYLKSLTLGQMQSRAKNASIHPEPFYFYFVQIFELFSPWILLLIGSLLVSWRKGIKQPAIHSFFISIIGTTFICLSMFSSKLGIYLLPIFPWLSFLIFLSLNQYQLKETKIAYFMMPFALVIFILAIIVKFMPIVEHFNPFSLSSNLLEMVFLICFLFANLSIWFIYQKNLVQTIYTIALFYTTLLFCLSLNVKPYNQFIGLNTLAQSIAQESEPQQEAFIWNFPAAQNMSLLMDKPIRQLNDKAQLAMLPSGSLLVTKHQAKDDMQNIVELDSAQRIGNHWLYKTK